MTHQGAPLKSFAEARMRREVEALAARVSMGLPGPKTVAGTPYVVFVNGEVKPEGAPIARFYGTPEELITASIAAVADYAAALPGPHHLIWRALPQIETRADTGPATYMRLAFEPAEAAPAPVAVVTNIDDPNITIVHTLERLLALAVAGDLRAFAYVTVAKAGIVGSSWVGAEDGHLHTLTSGAARLAQRLTAEDGH